MTWHRSFDEPLLGPATGHRYTVALELTPRR